MKDRIESECKLMPLADCIKHPDCNTCPAFSIHLYSEIDEPTKALEDE